VPTDRSNNCQRPLCSSISWTLRFSHRAAFLSWGLWVPADLLHCSLSWSYLTFRKPSIFVARHSSLSKHFMSELRFEPHAWTQYSICGLTYDLYSAIFLKVSSNHSQNRCRLESYLPTLQARIQVGWCITQISSFFCATWCPSLRQLAYQCPICISLQFWCVLNFNGTQTSSPLASSAKVAYC